MIEQKLLEKGITQEQLAAFAQSPRFPGKEEQLRKIHEARDWENIPAGFLKNLAEALADIGISQVEEYFPENTRTTRSGLSEAGYRLYVAEGMAAKMLKTLIENQARYQQYDETIGLDRIFKDTFGGDKK